MRDKFNLYKDALIEWNEKFNLTAITDPKEIETKHFEDSLSILQAIELTNQSVADIGTGAGFPGIPLKIASPNIKLTLIEATKKKTEFLKHIVNLLGLKDVEIIWGRAETLKNRQFDVVLARAVAKLPKLVEYCLPLVKSKGVFVAMKSQHIEEEIKEAGTILKKLGGKVKEIKRIILPSSGIARTLVIIEKNKLL
ncbi:MAG: 16S rRNA (guanine(527)-N(7))-methyltransferase RsmG [Candidatus Saganbacteria bacterium]|nr:16S rRNA (guanine(527)-N(7))-methyltransferase RsmG [Candidatus Saganbacteria bacterium]